MTIMHIKYIQPKAQKSKSFDAQLNDDKKDTLTFHRFISI